MLLISTPLSAHFFWLEAQPFHNRAGETVDISIHTGDAFEGDSLPNNVSLYTDFSLYWKNATSEIKGEFGRNPAGYFTPEHDGTYVIGYQSIFHFEEIAAATFNKYLAEEGLLQAINYRQQNQQQNSKGKERYVRHAKVLTLSGDGIENDYSQFELGYELELIPTENPYQKKVDESLSIKLFYKNRPATDVQVVAFSKKHPEQVQLMRSDQNGLVNFKLNQPGPWLVHSVKMIKLDGEKADWQSHWTSLTFAVR